MKIAYFGTADFSANILKSLISKSLDIKVIISQPDKIIGRKKEITQTPVKIVSIENNIDLLQPEKLRDNTELFEKLKKLDLDFIIVVAYGKIIPKEILDIPKYGCINIHGSILPLYRGASPIQESIKNGDKNTGLTIMYMSEGMDEGDIIDIKKINIDILDKTQDIFNKFENIGPDLLINSLENIVLGKSKSIKQDNFKATYCTKISKEDGQIDFEKEDINQIFNKFRAYYSWPGIYIYYKGKKFDITNCEIENNDLCYFDEDFNLGDVVEFEDHGEEYIGILCKGGILILNKVKLEGKKEMSIFDFLNGNKDFLEYNFLQKKEAV